MFGNLIVKYGLIIPPNTYVSWIFHAFEGCKEMIVWIRIFGISNTFQQAQLIVPQSTNLVLKTSYFWMQTVCIERLLYDIELVKD